MKQKSTSLTIAKHIHEKFASTCGRLGIKVGRKVEFLIEEWLACEEKCSPKENSSPVIKTIPPPASDLPGASSALVTELTGLVATWQEELPKLTAKILWGVLSTPPFAEHPEAWLPEIRAGLMDLAGREKRPRSLTAFLVERLRTAAATGQAVPIPALAGVAPAQPEKPAARHASHGTNPDFLTPEQITGVLSHVGMIPEEQRKFREYYILPDGRTWRNRDGKPIGNLYHVAKAWVNRSQSVPPAGAAGAFHSSRPVVPSISKATPDKNYLAGIQPPPVGLPHADSNSRNPEI